MGHLQDALFAFLCRKYVQRADDRQRDMGLQYTSAETHDLAKELARFISGQLGELPIQHMKPCEKPTEPGWYVYRDMAGENYVREVRMRDGGLHFIHEDGEDTPVANTWTDDLIARIFPEKITEQEG